MSAIADVREPEKREHAAAPPSVEPAEADVRATLDLVERYLSHTGPIASREVADQVLTELRTLLSDAVADGRPVHSVLGGDPVDVVDALLENHGGGRWDADARRRLARDVRDAVDARRCPDLRTGSAR